MCIQIHNKCGLKASFRDRFLGECFHMDYKGKICIHFPMLKVKYCLNCFIHDLITFMCFLPLPRRFVGKENVTTTNSMLNIMKYSIKDWKHFLPD